MLTDGLSDDLLTLGRRNELVRYLAKHMRREQLEQLPYRCVPYLVVSPPDGELARMASEHFDPALTDSYFPIGRLLAAAGEGAGRNELLSLIFFDRDYTEAQIKLGHDHAARAMNEGWRIGPQPNP